MSTTLEKWDLLKQTWLDSCLLCCCRWLLLLLSVLCLVFILLMMSVKCSHECLLRKRATNVSDVVQCVFDGNMAAVMMLLNWTTRGRMTKQLHGSTLKKDILTFTFVSRFKLFLKYRYFECYMLYLFDFVVWNCLFLLSLLLLLLLCGIRELCMNDNQLQQFEFNFTSNQNFSHKSALKMYKGCTILWKCLIVLSLKWSSTVLSHSEVVKVPGSQNPIHNMASTFWGEN